MRVITFLISSCLLLACTKQEPRSEWETYDFDVFTLQAPSKWRKFSAQGYDSKIGGVTDGKDTLHYDYGMYSYTFSKETSLTHNITETSRNGYPTKMVKPKKPGKGVTGIYYNLGNSLRLTFYGYSSNENLLVQIIESVQIR